MTNPILTRRHGGHWTIIAAGDAIEVYGRGGPGTGVSLKPGEFHALEADLAAARRFLAASPGPSLDIVTAAVEQAMASEPELQPIKVGWSWTDDPAHPMISAASDDGTSFIAVVVRTRVGRDHAGAFAVGWRIGVDRVEDVLSERVASVLKFGLLNLRADQAEAEAA